MNKIECKQKTKLLLYRLLFCFCFPVGATTVGFATSFLFLSKEEFKGMIKLATQNFQITLIPVTYVLKKPKQNI